MIKLHRSDTDGLILIQDPKIITAVVELPEDDGPRVSGKVYPKRTRIHFLGFVEIVKESAEHINEMIQGK